jgi:hypothetical protein
MICLAQIEEQKKLQDDLNKQVEEVGFPIRCVISPE